eukprot:scaffold846_cov202-Prasinococcus_capsulatus_cf.AAC.1
MWLRDFYRRPTNAPTEYLAQSSANASPHQLQEESPSAEEEQGPDGIHVNPEEDTRANDSDEEETPLPDTLPASVTPTPAKVPPLPSFRPAT